jgi:hypothetical protein
MSKSYDPNGCAPKGFFSVGRDFAGRMVPRAGHFLSMKKQRFTIFFRFF